MRNPVTEDRPARPAEPPAGRQFWRPGTPSAATIAGTLELLAGVAEARRREVDGE